jgi:hypothetical protein
MVDAFWEAGRAAGYSDDGPPGPRPGYGGGYCGGFLLDPDGMILPAPAREAVVAFHREAVESGFHEAAPPAGRHGRYSAAVRDPDANVVELAHRT